MNALQAEHHHITLLWSCQHDYLSIAIENEGGVATIGVVEAGAYEFGTLNLKNF